MSLENAVKYVTDRGYGERIKIFDVSSATVELAAKAVGTEPARIAKSLTFKIGERVLMILFAGDAKVDNKKYKARFQAKAKMLTAEEAEEYIGHRVGGICPFGIKEGVEVYLDESLKRFEVVYPACGSGNSAVELTISELEEISGYLEWVNVANIVA